jgi:uncharacterized protein (TIGR01777 family)
MKPVCVISGATGFIGRAISKFLSDKGYPVYGLSRNRDKKTGFVRWNPQKLDGWEDVMTKAGVIINLAGHSIGNSRWTKKTKNRILHSRIRSTNILIEALRKTNSRPDLFIQISGIGYYGSRGDEILDENSAPGSGFLSQVSQEWETSTAKLESMNIRRVIFRTGLVLGPNGGALKRMLPAYRFFLGGSFGPGTQWVPWIHLSDVCRAMEFAIFRQHVSGIFNLTAPQPVTNRQMTRTMGKILDRPTFFRLPAWIIRIRLGEMGEELLLSSQRALPRRLLQEGLEFSYPDLNSSLSNILTR